MTTTTEHKPNPNQRLRLEEQRKYVPALLMAALVLVEPKAPSKTLAKMAVQYARDLFEELEGGNGTT